MVNKSRPKKTRGAFYKKYTYGVLENADIDELADLYRPKAINMKAQAELFLPYEIIINILKMTPSPYCVNHLLLSRSIYWDLITEKYEHPKLQNNNLLPFLETISGDRAACVGTDDSGIIGIGMEGNTLVSEVESLTLEDEFDFNDEDDILDTNESKPKKKANYKSIKKKVKESKKSKNNNSGKPIEPAVTSNLSSNSIVKKFHPKNYLRHKFLAFVRVLDMSLLVQSGKNSYIAKLLRRTSDSLEVFISSQSSFGTAPLVALKSCHKLKVLDLRLVSESVNLVELFRSIEQLPELEQLCFPRSSVTCDSFDFKWPANLWYLRLQGGITDLFASQVTLPSTITCLELAHCPHLTSSGLDHILAKNGFNLTRLSITYPMPKLGDMGCDRSFWYCPNLKHFVVDVAYISWELFCDDLLIELEDYSRPLKYMRIESTGYMGMCEKVTPNDITIAVDEGRLPLLKIVEISAMLGWDFKGQEMDDMVSELDHHGVGVFKV